MRQISLILVGLFALSCASKTEVATKLAFKRISAPQEGKERPAFFYFEYKPALSRGRAPASISTSAHSVKEVYFLGLWEQKKRMESVLSISSNESCPAFHQVLLQVAPVTTFEKSYNLKKDWEQIALRGEVVANPVLALPTEDGNDLIGQVADGSGIDQEDVKRAFETYYGQTRKEVKELCDTGSSDGYFVFANMVQYFSNDRSFMFSNEALQALLKVAPVGNYYVLQSLASGSYSGPGRFEAQLLKRLNALWFQDYVELAKKSKNNKISSNMAGNKQ